MGSTRRYANIYTARQLLQMLKEALGEYHPADAIWEKDARHYDAMRPSVEPQGLGSREAVLDQRKHHLRKVREVFQTADLFVFTLGLTEVWEHSQSGTVYPTAPGTLAGSYDPGVHAFRNLTFREIYDDMAEFFSLAREINPGMRFLLTVSPVPLTATASGEHVLAATTYSKSVLRAVAGQLFHEREEVDYFPSYEIITSSLAKAKYFKENLRSVRNQGVEAAMSAFFQVHDADGMPRAAPEGDGEAAAKGSDADGEPGGEVCEEVLLEAFAR